MKKVISLLFVSLICITLIIPCYAAEFENPPVVDTAEILSESQLEELTEKAEEVRQKYNFEVAIVTETEMSGYDAMATADDIYDYEGYGAGENDDGILLWMLIVVLSAANAAETTASVQSDGIIVGGTDLQRQEGQTVGLCKIQKNLQQLPCNALTAALRPHGHVGDVTLVHHHQQARIAQHLAALILRQKIPVHIVGVEEGQFFQIFHNSSCFPSFYRLFLQQKNTIQKIFFCMVFMNSIILLLQPTSSYSDSSVISLI